MLILRLSQYYDHRWFICVCMILSKNTKLSIHDLINLKHMYFFSGNYIEGKSSASHFYWERNRWVGWRSCSSQWDGLLHHVICCKYPDNEWCWYGLMIYWISLWTILSMINMYLVSHTVIEVNLCHHCCCSRRSYFPSDRHEWGRTTAGKLLFINREP